jgi:small subunit ribosomal protein S8
MAMTDTLSDMLARINNGQAARLYSVKIINSKLNAAVLELLKQEGFIESYAKKRDEGESYDHLIATLKYDSGVPVIRSLKRVSTAGRRVYCKVGKIPKVYNGLGISILSTSKGVVCNNAAAEQNIGGELLCTVF